MPVVSRRRVLAGGGRGLLGLALLGSAAVACGPSRPPGPDPLEAELRAARADSELATEAAKNAPPPTAASLREVAALRTRHAEALVEELARAAGEPLPAETTATGTTSANPADKPEPPPTVGDVVGALRSSAQSAARLVPTLSGYRAGLMGSIAAACTATFTVGLKNQGRQR
ncbi:MAG: hypothetical protein FGM52_09835 [Mycobacterium sp.]|nr:hypothetical protein [Mycobacterium sp.]